jgi:hypothetical protein
VVAVFCGYEPHAALRLWLSSSESPATPTSRQSVVAGQEFRARAHEAGAGSTLRARRLGGEHQGLPHLRPRVTVGRIGGRATNIVPLRA